VKADKYNNFYAIDECNDLWGKRSILSIIHEGIFTEGADILIPQLEKTNVTNVMFVDAIGTHSIIHTKNKVFGCGDNMYGQLGIKIQKTGNNIHPLTELHLKFDPFDYNKMTYIKWPRL